MDCACSLYVYGYIITMVVCVASQIRTIKAVQLLSAHLSYSYQDDTNYWINTDCSLYGNHWSLLNNVSNLECLDASLQPTNPSISTGLI